MDFTIEQARVLEAVARLGTVQKAAQELHKGHSSVLYALKNLEKQLNLNLFDRTGHRNRLTKEGQAVLKYCRQILEACRELGNSCQHMNAGWEPSLKLIYDGIIDFNFVCSALSQLNKIKTPTEIKVLAAHLNEVEPLFLEESADLMLTVLPLQTLQKLEGLHVQLKPIKMYLVAHAEHPLFSGNSAGLPRPTSSKTKRHKISTAELKKHTFVKVKTSPIPIGLSTDNIEFESYIYVNDFMTKRMTILKKLGFGWLPDYLVRAEIEKGTLKVLPTERSSTHTLHPRIFHRPNEFVGKTASELIRIFRHQD